MSDTPHGADNAASLNPSMAETRAALEEIDAILSRIHPPTLAEGFCVTSRTDQGATQVALVGELDGSVTGTLDHVMAALVANGSETRSIVIDLAELRFLDSAGLRALLRSMRLAQSAGCTVELIHPAPAVRRLVTLAERTRPGEQVHGDLNQTDSGFTLVI